MVTPISAISAQALGAAAAFDKSAGASAAGAPVKSFSDVLQAGAADAAQAVRRSEEMSAAAIHDKASLQEVVQSVVQAEMAVESVVAVRNKLIEAFQEIYRMPI